MKLLFLGVGEACDPAHGNTSLLLADQAGTSLLLDCGFSVPHRFFARVRDADRLDGLWISHFHGDHCFGVPLLLLRFWEMGRKKPLTILGQEGTGERLTTLLELAYPGFADRLCFELRFQLLEPGVSLMFRDLRLQAAETVHSQKNLGIRIDSGRTSIYYSGDGRASREAITLMTGCDLLVHEAFRRTDSVENHGSLQACLGLLETSAAHSIALVHLERTFRIELEQTLAEELGGRSDVLLPHDGDELFPGEQAAG